MDGGHSCHERLRSRVSPLVATQRQVTSRVAASLDPSEVTDARAADGALWVTE
jgi:hypothetical protein